VKGRSGAGKSERGSKIHQHSDMLEINDGEAEGTYD